MSLLKRSPFFWIFSCYVEQKIRVRRADLLEYERETYAFFKEQRVRNTTDTHYEYERETHRRWRLYEAIFVESNFKWVVWWTKKTALGKYRRESVVWSLVCTRAYLLSLALNAPENSYKYTYTRFYSSCEFSALESLRPSRYQQMYKSNNREAIFRPMSS